MSNPQQGSQYGQGSHKDNPGSGQHSGQQPQHQQQQDPQKSGHGSGSGQQGGVATPKQGEAGHK